MLPYFNTAGASIPGEHYMLSPEPRFRHVKRLERNAPATVSFLIRIKGCLLSRSYLLNATRSSAMPSLPSGRNS